MGEPENETGRRERKTENPNRRRERKTENQDGRDEPEHLKRKNGVWREKKEKLEPGETMREKTDSNKNVKIDSAEIENWRKDEKSR